MNSKRIRTQTNGQIGALGGFFIVSFFLKGLSIDEIAQKCGCSYMFVTQLCSAYLELQKQSFKNEKMLIRLDSISSTYSENELIDMSYSRFYEFTKLDPNNRWWVGKGKLS